MGVWALKRVSDRTAEQHAARNSAGVFAEPDASGESRVARQFVVDGASLAFGRRIMVQRDLKRSLAPRRDRFHEAGHCSLQHRRAIAEVGGLADRRVDRRIERDDAAQEVAPKTLETGRGPSWRSENSRRTRP